MKAKSFGTLKNFTPVKGSKIVANTTISATRSHFCQAFFHLILSHIVLALLCTVQYTVEQKCGKILSPVWDLSAPDSDPQGHQPWECFFFFVKSEIIHILLLTLNQELGKESVLEKVGFVSTFLTTKLHKEVFLCLEVKFNESFAY